ncbi:hypothetical protein H5410_061782 [Solanum commersonii]|uniref:Uncharacterized protein n=1 Tax=Solanum commersonii TaxID=4109 RepID=A0A9J5WA84_SOLCO|nr:hypothetical protein H5410_061782 [Solanum commersonii]
MLAFSIFTFWTIGRYSTVSRNYSTRRLLLSSPSDPLPSGLRILEQRAESVPLANRQRFLAMLMLQLLCCFQPLFFPFCT